MKKVVFLIFVLFLLTTGVYLYYSFFHKNIVGKNIRPEPGPDISVSPDELNFGNAVASPNQPATSIPATQDLVITNNGDEDLIVEDIHIPSNDYITVSESTFTILPSLTHTITFTFAPEYSGEYDNNIKILSNDPNTPSLSVDYLGVGIEPLPQFGSGEPYPGIIIFSPYGITPFQTESYFYIVQYVPQPWMQIEPQLFLDLEDWTIKILLGDGNFNIIPLSYGQFFSTTNLTYENEGLLYTKAQLINPDGEIVDEIMHPVFAAANLYNPKYYYPNYEINTENGYLILDGNRFFPIGGLVTTRWNADINEMVEAKMNFIWYYGGYESLGVYVNEFGDFSANDIKIIFGSHNSVVPTNYDPTFLPLYTQEDIIVGLVSDSEFGNIIGWSNRDEPGWVNISIDDVEEAYNTIREYDPNRVIFMNFAPAHPTDNLQEYIDENRIYSQYADVISLDIYPIMDSCFDNPPVCVCSEGHPSWDPFCILNNPDISVVGDFVDLFKQQIIQDDDKPFWMNLQAFKSSLDQQINPTYEQMRFMTYQSIIHGATGVYYYSDSNNGFDPDILEDLKKITQELSDLSNVLTTDYNYRAINTIDGIEYLEIPYSNYLYIIAVNRRNEVVQKSFDTDAPNSIVTVISENRQLNTNPAGIFTDTFQPFDMHIYEIPISQISQYILIVNPISGNAPLTASFNLQGDFPINSQFRWYFGDQVVTNTQTSMQHIYNNQGNYQAFVQILQNGQIIDVSNNVLIGVSSPPPLLPVCSWSSWSSYTCYQTDMSNNQQQNCVGSQGCYPDGIVDIECEYAGASFCKYNENGPWKCRSKSCVNLNQP